MYYLSQLERLAKKLNLKNEKLKRLKETIRKMELQKEVLETDISAISGKIDGIKMNNLNSKLKESGLNLAEIDIDKVVDLLSGNTDLISKLHFKNSAPDKNVGNTADNELNKTDEMTTAHNSFDASSNKFYQDER